MMFTPTCDIQLAPGADRVLEAALTHTPASLTWHRLQLLAERLLLVAGFDELVCLDRLNFAPFDYQVKAVQVALRRFRGRGLLCDEVGLGKTSSAGWPSSAPRSGARPKGRGWSSMSTVTPASTPWSNAAEFGVRW